MNGMQRYTISRSANVTDSTFWSISAVLSYSSILFEKYVILTLTNYHRSITCRLPIHTPTPAILPYVHPLSIFMRCLMWLDTVWACWVNNVISEMIMLPSRRGPDPRTSCNCLITLITAHAVCQPNPHGHFKVPTGGSHRRVKEVVASCLFFC